MKQRPDEEVEERRRNRNFLCDDDEVGRRLSLYLIWIRVGRGDTKLHLTSTFLWVRLESDSLPYRTGNLQFLSSTTIVEPIDGPFCSDHPIMLRRRRWRSQRFR